MNSSTSGGKRLPRRRGNQGGDPGSNRSVSAVLAVLLGEDGGENVIPHLAAGCISTVNVAEVLTNALRMGASLEAARDFLARLGLEVVPFDCSITGMPSRPGRSNRSPSRITSRSETV